MPGAPRNFSGIGRRRAVRERCIVRFRNVGERGRRPVRDAEDLGRMEDADESGRDVTFILREHVRFVCWVGDLLGCHGLADCGRLEITLGLYARF